MGLVWRCLIEMGVQIVGLKLRHDENRKGLFDHRDGDLDLRIVGRYIVISLSRQSIHTPERHTATVTLHSVYT